MTGDKPELSQLATGSSGLVRVQEESRPPKDNGNLQLHPTVSHKVWLLLLLLVLVLVGRSCVCTVQLVPPVALNSANRMFGGRCS